VFGLYWGAVIAAYLAIQERVSNARPGGLVDRAAASTSSARDFSAPVFMFVIVCIGWVYFRADSMSDAWYVLTHMFTATGAADVVRPEIANTATLWTLIVSLCAAEWVYRHWPDLRQRLEGQRLSAIAGRYALLAAIIVSSGASQLDGARPFIYFQF
jgi:alginate O-acetyltransferase complex protein AlgI